VGWISQWKEQLGDTQMKIGRPRQLYLGEATRDYSDIENR
jgi:citrate synthase